MLLSVNRNFIIQDQASVLRFNYNYTPPKFFKIIDHLCINNRIFSVIFYNWANSGFANYSEGQDELIQTFYYLK